MESLIVMKKRETCADASESLASPQKKGAGGMETGSTCSTMWVDMTPEVLANIFSRLSLKQLLCVIPCVCKPWMQASHDPLCWQVLDLRELPFKATYRLVQVFLRRTEGHLRELVFPYMNHPDWLKVLENSASVLQKLHIPCSCASNEWAINVAPLMMWIADLDLSRTQLSHEALEAFGKHCRHITHLRWNEDRLQVGLQHMSNDPSKNDSAAFAIAMNYPSLKHLELRNNPISTQGVRAILNGCPMLEHLDLTACVMDIDEPLLRECRTRLRVFLEPQGTDEVSDNEDEDDDGNDIIGISYHDGWRAWCRFVDMCSSESDDSNGLDECHVRHNREYDDDFGDIEDEYGIQSNEEEEEDDDDGDDDDDDDEDEGENEDEDKGEGDDEDEYKK